MSGQNDDAMVAVLKNKINALENQQDETEKKYEQQIHNLKKKLHDATKESTNLRLQVKSLEKKLDSLEANQEPSSEYLQKKVDEMNRQLAEKDETLMKLANENITLDNKYNELREVASLKDESEDDPGKKFKKISRKRDGKGLGDSRPSSREGANDLSLNMIRNLQGDAELKRLLALALEEKARVEKINTELTNKVMTMSKNQDDEKEARIAEAERKNKLQIQKLITELEESKRLREESEREYLKRMTEFGDRLHEKNMKIKTFEQGIQDIKLDQKLRDDTSYGSTQMVKYLEKFANYQNEFMKQEMKRFQDDFSNLKSGVKANETELKSVKDDKIKLEAQHSRMDNELQMSRELMVIKGEEVEDLKVQNKNLQTAMESLRREKAQISNLKKFNNELKNQLIHYKAMVRRANNGAMGNMGAIGTVGVDEEKKDNEPGPYDFDNDKKKMEYGFDKIKKNYEDAQSESKKVEVLSKVVLA